MNEDEFFAWCQRNRDLRCERTAQGDVIIMSPAGGETSNRNVRLNAVLTVWALNNGSGEPFDSSTGFVEAIQEKMQEYLANGTRLGWLIDPLDRRGGCIGLRPACSAWTIQLS